MPTRKLIGLATAVACAAWMAPLSSSATRPDARARFASQQASSEPCTATLAELHADALAFLGRSVRVRFQLDGEQTSWNPYLTRFGAADYRAWRTWGDEQFLWRSNDWENPIGMLFVRRGKALEQALAAAPRYARFEAVGRVRQVFLGKPWIELEQIERMHSEVDEASLVHASRAMLLMDNERWQLAMEDIDRALAGDLPEHARAELWRVRTECQTHVPH